MKLENGFIEVPNELITEVFEYATDSLIVKAVDSNEIIFSIKYDDIVSLELSNLSTSIAPSCKLFGINWDGGHGSLILKRKRTNDSTLDVISFYY